MRRLSSMNVTTIKKRPMAGRYLQKDTKRHGVSGLELGTRPRTWTTTKQDNDNHNVRFNGVCQCIQPVLDLACLLSNGIQRTGVVCRVGSPRTSEGVLVSEIIARGATDLRHGGQTNKQEKRNVGEGEREREKARRKKSRVQRRKNESRRRTEGREKRERERKGSYYDALSASGHDDRNCALGPTGHGCQGRCIWPSDDINIAYPLHKSAFLFISIIYRVGLL